MSDDDFPDITSPRIALTPQEPPRGGLSADPHDDPATRWESGPDGEFTRVMIYGEKPAWLWHDDGVKFRSVGKWESPADFVSSWGEYGAFYLRRRPPLDEGLVALIYDAAARSSDAMDEARNIARALLAAGWRKEGA